MRHKYRLARWATSRWPSAILIALFGLWGAQHLGGFSWSWDEGVILMTGRSLAQGYALYDPLWYNYPPLLAQLLALLFRVTQMPTLAVARMLALGFSLLLLAGTAQLVWTLSRDGLLTLAATTLLVFSWPFLANSRAVLADVPALSLAVWSLAIASRASNRSSHWSCLTAGALLGASLAIKPTSVFALLPLAWPLLLDQRYRWQRLLCLAFGGLLAVGLSLAMVDLGAFWHQFAGSLATQQQAPTPRLTKNLGLIWQLLTYAKYGPPQYLLPALCLAGIWSLVSDSRMMRQLMVTWLGAGLLIWLFYSPLYSHHLVTLLPPLIILAALGLRRLACWGNEHLKGTASGWMALACLALLAFGIASTGWTTHPMQLPDDDDEDRDALVAAERIQNWLSPDDFMVTDSLALAFVAQRNVPPEMVNASSWRIASGQLTADQAIAWTEQYQPQAVVFWDDRLEELASYVSRVQAEYYLTEWYGKERRVYRPEPGPEHRTEIAFEGLLLDGYTLLDPAPGKDEIQIALYWRASDIPGHATTELAFAVTDSPGQTHKILKTKLAEGELRPSHWTDGDRIVRTYQIPVDGLASGTYTLHLTMLHTEEVIAARSADGLAESVALASWQQH